MKYLLIPFVILTIALSGCSNIPNSKIEDFADMYFEHFKNSHFTGMYNMFYEKTGIIFPRFKSTHENILERLGSIKEIKKGHIIGYDFSFGGNIYELIYDIEFERYKGVYGVKVLNRKNKLYMAGWYVDSIGLTSKEQNTFASVSPSISEEFDSKEEAVIPRPLNSYPNMPYKELIFPLSQVPLCHAPSIVELPDGGLFAVWYGSSPWGSDSAIWGSTRPLGAREWTAPSLIHDTPGRSDQNPVLYLGRDKKLWLFWAVEKSQYRLWLFYILGKSQSKWREVRIWTKVSKNFGYTWREARDLGLPSGFFSRTHPIRLHDGRVIFPLYMDWITSSAVVTSRDDGLTWGRPRYILYFLGIQPTVIQRSDLSLFALMRSGTWPHYSWQAVSGDLGRSWKNHRISDIKNPGSSLEMVKLHSGYVALIFNDSKTERSNLSLALSCDEGRTWPYVRVIEDKTGYFYPSIIQDRSGLIHVVYSYNEQNSIAHFVTDEEWIKGN